MTYLDDLLESIVTKDEAASPRAISIEALGDIYPDHAYEVLEAVLPVYVRQWLADRRKWKEPTDLPPEPTFAPDDLLSDEGQATQVAVRTGRLKARGSARVNAIRTEWQRHFNDSLWNGSRYIKFGDATADDLLNAAQALRTAAQAEFEGKQAKATYYEKIAANLTPGSTVRDLTDDPTRV